MSEPSKQKKKKILIATGIFYPDIGGPASYGQILAEKMSVDYQVIVITYSSVLRSIFDREKNYKIVRIWRKLPKGIRHLVYFLRILILTKKADVVLGLNAVTAGWPAMMAAKIFRKRFVVRVVGDYAWEVGVGKGKTSLLIDDFQKSKKSGWIGRLHKIQAKVCKKADLIIVPSRYLADLVGGWGIPPVQIKIVHNGVNFEPLGLTREEARVKIGIPGNIIISIGRLVPWKGFRMLVKIMPQLLAINSFFRLIIVGDGPERRPLETMIKNLRLEKKVILVGGKNQSEVATFLAASDFFILNTGYEGFSHQILEALSAGVPVITTNVGGNPEIIKQGENGFMIKYNDEFNLIEAIKTIWQSEELKNNFIEAGKKTVVEFNVEKMVRETIKILDNE